MTLQETLAEAAPPGAVALVARAGDVELATYGETARDAIFRIASLTKPVTAAAVLLLLDEGRLAFDDPNDMRRAIAGRPVWLAMAMDERNRLVLKPQNLLMNLPLARPQ